MCKIQTVFFSDSNSSLPLLLMSWWVRGRGKSLQVTTNIVTYIFIYFKTMWKTASRIVVAGRRGKAVWKCECACLWFCINEYVWEWESKLEENKGPPPTWPEFAAKTAKWAGAWWLNTSAGLQNGVFLFFSIRYWITLFYPLLYAWLCQGKSCMIRYGHMWAVGYLGLSAISLVLANMLFVHLLGRWLEKSWPLFAPREYQLQPDSPMDILRGTCGRI